MIRLKILECIREGLRYQYLIEKLPMKLQSYLLCHIFLFLIIGANSCFSQIVEPRLDSLNKKRLYTIIGVEGAAYIGGISFLSYVWYKDKERVPFHLYNDSKGYLQMDKAGHAFSAYHESVAAYKSLRWAGVSKKKALWFGGPAGILFQTPIVIFDGLYKGWGFSWPDMAANTFGSVLFMGQEALFDQQIVRMKFSYAPSIYPEFHATLGETPLESFFLDYNAHTYWLSGNIRSITGVQKIPPWLNFAFGYSSNGVIKEFENPKFYQGQPFPDIPRYRQYLFSLDVDFSKIKTKKKWLKLVLKTVNIIKVPFPAVEINRIDGFRLRPLYF